MRQRPGDGALGRRVRVPGPKHPLPLGFPFSRQEQQSAPTSAPITATTMAPAQLQLRGSGVRCQAPMRVAPAMPPRISPGAAADGTHFPWTPCAAPALDGPAAPTWRRRLQPLPACRSALRSRTPPRASALTWRRTHPLKLLSLPPALRCALRRCSPASCPHRLHLPRPEAAPEAHGHGSSDPQRPNTQLPHAHRPRRRRGCDHQRR